MTRLAPVDHANASRPSQELLDGVQKKLGMTPNMMKTMAHSPATLKAYLTLSESLAGGALSTKTRELIALAVGEANGCNYCLSAHSAIGKMVGLSDDQVLEARQGRSEDAKVNAILNFAVQVVEKRGQVSDQEVAAVRSAGVSDAEITEIVANTALNLFTNYFNQVADTNIDFPVAEPLHSACDAGCSA